MVESLELGYEKKNARNLNVLSFNVKIKIDPDGIHHSYKFRSRPSSSLHLT